MKKVKNLVALFVIVIGSLSATQAQNIDAGANIGLALPTGDFGDVYDPGFSWNIFGFYHFSDQVSAGLEIGGSSFSGEIDLGIFGTQSLDFTLTEILAVGNFVFLDSDGLRLGGGIGAGFFSSDGGSEVGLSPRFFAQYMVSENIGLNAQLPFNMVLTGGGDFNYIVFRVGGFYRIDM
jgi:hypothetical protein